jgi:hypothetical protein
MKVNYEGEEVNEIENMNGEELEENDIYETFHE